MDNEAIVVLTTGAFVHGLLLVVNDGVVVKVYLAVNVVVCLHDVDLDSQLGVVITIASTFFVTYVNAKDDANDHNGSTYSLLQLLLVVRLLSTVLTGFNAKFGFASTVDARFDRFRHPLFLLLWPGGRYGSERRATCDTNVSLS